MEDKQNVEIYKNHFFWKTFHSEFLGVIWENILFLQVSSVTFRDIAGSTSADIQTDGQKEGHTDIKIKICRVNL